jgi:hypothetical protein
MPQPFRRVSHNGVLPAYRGKQAISSTEEPGACHLSIRAGG